jgi:hypothetical protein
MKIGLFAITGLLLAAPAIHAATISVNLGQSAQNYLLTGTGTNASGDGTYINTQGSCVAGVGSTTCSLTGSYTGTTPGFTSGTYDFITTYLGVGPSPVVSESNGVGSDSFFYDAFPTSANVTMSVVLDDVSGTDSDIALFGASGFVPGAGWFFTNVTATCTGLGALPCTQFNVGTVAGATQTGPVTIAVSFDTADVTPVTTAPSAVPEPSTLALLGTGIVSLAGAARRKMLSRS